LGAGVYRLARRQALDRRAVWDENIGRVTCLCSDQTGTMSEGRRAVVGRQPGAGMGGDARAPLAGMARRAETGDPLDVALLALAAPGAEGAADPIHLHPLTEARRRETAVHADEAGGVLAVTKGAPETLLAVSAMAEPERASW